jgi:multimeric flavodoxin WrbA
MKILVISTTTQFLAKSTSVALADVCVHALKQRCVDPQVRFIDASKLHIVENLSCYASGEFKCADPKSGPYRCWAHELSMKNPKKYGGKDEMGAIYDGLEWCDALVFVTSNRWGSHSALAQRIIERMNTLENRGSSYGEPYPLHYKKLGIIVAGLHWETARIGQHLLSVLRWFGFATCPDESNVLTWQRTRDMYFEHPDPDKPYALHWASTPTGQQAIAKWADAVITGDHVLV